MPQLQIHLQEGFVDDDVVIRIDGHEEARESGVRTRMQTGMARIIELFVGDTTVEVGVDVPGRDLSGAKRIDASTIAQLGVSITGDELRFTTSAEAFRYA